MPNGGTRDNQGRSRLELQPPRQFGELSGLPSNLSIGKVDGAVEFGERRERRLSDARQVDQPALAVAGITQLALFDGHGNTLTVASVSSA